MSTPTVSERDLMWAAIVFEEKAKVHMAGKKVYLQVNSKQSKEIVPRLVTLFGGKAYYFGDKVSRWQIGGNELFAFLEKIRPQLTETGTKIIQELATLQEALSGKPVVTSIEKVDAFNVLEGVDEDQMDLLENQWEMFPADEDGRVVLRTHSREHSKEWGYALNQRGYSIEIVHDTLVYVNRRADADRRQANA